MTTWEDKFIRFVAERWVFQGSDPHRFTPRLLLIAFGEDFLSSHLERHEHFGTLYSGHIGDRQIGYVRVPPGTVILEGIMRSLVFTRVDTVIGLGTCGALQPEIDCGDIVVADSAQAGEALSRHYGFEQDQVIEADGPLTAALADSLAQQGLPAHTGPIVTTGSVFRETEELIESWSGNGYMGVELEAAGLFALGAFLKIRTAMALLVTDSPVRRETSEALKGKGGRSFVEGIKGFLRAPGVYANLE